MQIREQWKASRNWKLVTGVATAATLGIGAIAVASPGTNDVPQSIDLNDRAIVSEATVPTTFGSFVPFDASFDSVSNDSITGDSITGDSITNDSITNDSITNDSIGTDSVSIDSVSMDSVSLDSVSDDSNDSA
ncbi:MAG TPA: hypothetical protein VLB67_14755 [Acidimicrobiia bacterium]|nr:hypothetical protein [Acidimicrobiia bacterium]